MKAPDPQGRPVSSRRSRASSAKASDTLSQARQYAKISSRA